MDGSDTQAGGGQAAPVTEQGTKVRGRRTLRWLLGEIHLWAGLVLFLPLVLLGLSGSYLVYHDEIDGLLSGQPAVEASAGESRPVAEIIAAAAAEAPQGFAASMISMPEAAGDPAVVRLGPPGASFRDPKVLQVMVDPVTLKVLGAGGSTRSALTGFMHDLHGHALLSGGTGRQIIGWLGVVMVFLGISGLVIWWPRAGGLWAALTVKRGARGFHLHRDLHGAVGFWALGLFLVVSVTGVYIAFPQVLAAGVGMALGEEPTPRARVRVKAPDGGTPMALDAMAALARQAVPDAALAMVAMPFRPGQAARVRFHVPDAAAGAPMIAVMIDPWRGKVLSVQDPRRLRTTDWITTWQRPLHEGGGLGAVWRFLVFLSGLLPLLFAITGISMWWLKRRARAAALNRRGA